MATPETQVSKSASGWQAITRIDLGDHKILTIDTHKNSAGLGGQLVSSACVATVDDRGTMTYVFGAGTGKGDFFANLIARTIRVTEKAVLAQHETALAMVELEGLKARIARHYALQTANQTAVNEPAMAA